MYNSLNWRSKNGVNVLSGFFYHHLLLKPFIVKVIDQKTKEGDMVNYLQSLWKNSLFKC